MAVVEQTHPTIDALPPASMPGTSDELVVHLLRRHGRLSVSQIATHMQVTATAVRQRLARLTGQGLIQRVLTRAQRGRPSHGYELTDKARKEAGTNFPDLAIALWKEIRALPDPEVRRGLLQRLAESLAAQYSGRVGQGSTTERMQNLCNLLKERNVDFSVTDAPASPAGVSGLPILTAHDCPYPDLVAVDRGICALEKMMFSHLLNSPVRLMEYRPGGGSCCQFITS